MALKILVIGGVAAGPKAAARARRCDPAAEITLLEQGPHLSYAGCGMPYYIGAVVRDWRHLLETAAGTPRDEAYFAGVKGIKVHTGVSARAIDREGHRVRALDLARGRERAFAYDRLVLATGSLPVRLEVPGGDLDRVFTLGSLGDAVAIRQALDSGEVRRVALVGGGLIGLELVDALAGAADTVAGVADHRRGAADAAAGGARTAVGPPAGGGRPPLEVTLVELMDSLAPGVLDPDLGALLSRQLEARGVRLLLGHRLLRFEGQGGRLERVVTDGASFPADMAVVAVGVRPNAALAREAGLEIGPTGAIAVDERLCTSDPDVYAGGDCVENRHLLTGRPVYAPLGSTANRQGRVLGDNVTGGRRTFPGVLGTVIFKVLGLNAGRTGLSERQARDAGFGPVSVVVAAVDRAHFYPGSASLVMNLVADASSHRVLGLQAVGAGDVARRLDVVAAGLQAGAAVAPRAALTLEQLANLDLAYAPPFSTAIDPLQHAANVLLNKLDGRMAGVSARQLKDRLATGEDFVLLDVREPEEVRRLRLDDCRAVNVPLPELRQRLDEVPRDRPVYTVCRAGVRAYEALTILKAAGWVDVRLLEGGLTAWPYEAVGE